MLQNTDSCAHQILNRRFQVITLASVLTTLCLFLAWNHYGLDISEPYQEDQTAHSQNLGSGNVPIEASKIPEVNSVTSAGKAQPTVSSSDATDAPNDPLRVGNATLLRDAPRYIHAILDPSDDSFQRLSCPVPTSGRYDYLRGIVAQATMAPPSAAEKPKYFFALNLHQCVHLLPRLLGSVVEAMQFLGPQNCALSIVEGVQMTEPLKYYRHLATTWIEWELSSSSSRVTSILKTGTETIVSRH
jgi:hypothetical protein